MVVERTESAIQMLKIQIFVPRGTIDFYQSERTFCLSYII